MIEQPHLDKVLGYIEKGRAEGARIVTGGERTLTETGGYFVAPTIFDDVRNTMTIAREEIFGPVISLVPFDDEDEAIALANQTSYGLAASVYTTNLDRAIRFARAIRAGTVGVNAYSEGDITTPFGGYKESGFGGRDKGLEAFEQYTEKKTIWFALGGAQLARRAARGGRSLPSVLPPPPPGRGARGSAPPGLTPPHSHPPRRRPLLPPPATNAPPPRPAGLRPPPHPPPPRPPPTAPGPRHGTTRVPLPGRSRPARDRDDRDHGRDQRRRDADHECRTGRDRERCVDRVDDPRDQRLHLGTERLRYRGQDPCAEVADPGQLIERVAPPLAKSLRELGGHPRRGQLLGHLLEEGLGEDRAGDRQSDGAADLLEQRQAAGRRSEVADRHRVLDTSVNTAKAGPIPRPTMAIHSQSSGIGVSGRMFVDR